MTNCASRANAVACRLDRPVRPRVFFGRWVGDFVEHRARSIPNTALFEHAPRARRKEQPFEYCDPYPLTARRSTLARSANHQPTEDLRAFRDAAEAKVLEAAARWASALQLCKQEQARCCVDEAGELAARPEQRGFARGLTLEVRRTQRHGPARRNIHHCASRGHAVACRLDRPVRHHLLADAPDAVAAEQASSKNLSGSGPVLLAESPARFSRNAMS